MSKRVSTRPKLVLKKPVKIGLLITGIIVFVIGIIAYAVPKLKSKANDDLLTLLYDPLKPVAYKENGLYGYMDSKGHELIRPSYLTAGSFYGEYALVSQEKDDEIEYQIINKKGESIKTANSAYKPAYYKDLGVWLIDNALYDKKLQEIFSEPVILSHVSDGYFSYRDDDGSQTGIINSAGQKIFTWDEKYISIDVSESQYYSDDLYAVVSNANAKEEIIEMKTGKVVYELEDPRNSHLEVERNNIFKIITVREDEQANRWMYIKNGQIAYESRNPIYSMELVDYKKGILKIDYGSNYEALGLDTQITYVEASTGRQIDSIKDDEINDWMLDIYGYKIDYCDGLYGLSTKDKELLECAYTNIAFPQKNIYDYLKKYHNKPFAIVENKTDFFIFDMQKKKEVQFYSMASLKSSEGSSFFTIERYENDGFTKKDIIIYNAITGEDKIFPANCDVVIYENYITVNDFKKMTYYNTDLKVIYEGEAY